MFFCIIVIVVSLFAGCETYQPQPLIARQSLQEVEKSRDILEEANFLDANSNSIPLNREFTFLKAAELLAKNNSNLKEAYFTYKRAYELAEVKTPLPNPRLELGALIGSNLGDEGSGVVQPLIAFGFTIPLGSRLTQQDELNSTRAKYAYLQYLLQHRKEYLRLRRYYIEWILLLERREVHRTIVRFSQDVLEITKKLIDSGFATAADIGIAELELLQRELALDSMEQEIIGVKGKLSEILGVRSDFFALPENVTSPALLKEIPTMEKLKNVLLANNDTLALLQATYQIVEKKLHLEISKQTPDIIISSSFEGDPGDDKKIWGLSVSFPLPVFDRNQQSITSKKGKRNLVRAQYQGALNRSLAVIETSYHNYLYNKKRFEQMNEGILKKAKNNAEIALKILKRGESNFLTYVDFERSLYSILLEVHRAKRQMYRSWLNIESTIGIPIWFLPEENENNIPSIVKGATK